MDSTENNLENHEIGELDTENTIQHDISKTNIRYFMLFLACFLCVGSYFTYDSPSALGSELKKV